MFCRIPAAWMLLIMILTTGLIDSSSPWMNANDQECCSSFQSACHHHGSARLRVAHKYGVCVHDMKSLKPETKEEGTGHSISNNCSCDLEQRPSSNFPQSIAYRFVKEEQKSTGKSDSSRSLENTLYDIHFSDPSFDPETPPPEILL